MLNHYFESTHKNPFVIFLLGRFNRKFNRNDHFQYWNLKKSIYSSFSILIFFKVLNLFPLNYGNYSNIKDTKTRWIDVLSDLESESDSRRT